MNEKDYVYIDKKLAEKIKQFESIELQEEAVKDVIRKKKLDLSSEFEQLDESLLMFKSTCLTHKKELEKIYKEQAEALYNMWETDGDVGSTIIQHARKMANELHPVKTEIRELIDSIKELKKLTGELHLPYKFVESVEAISRMNSETKDLLSRFLKFSMEEPKNE